MCTPECTQENAPTLVNIQVAVSRSVTQAVWLVTAARIRGGDLINVSIQIVIRHSHVGQR